MPLKHKPKTTNQIMGTQEDDDTATIKDGQQSSSKDENPKNKKLMKKLIAKGNKKEQKQKEKEEKAKKKAEEKERRKKRKGLERTTTNIEYKFTETELKQDGQRLAELNEKKVQKLQEKASISSQIGSEIKNIDSEIALVSRRLRTKTETRTVPALLKLNFKQKRREYLSLDKKKVLKTEDLLTTDYQLKLDHAVETAETGE